MARTSLPPGFRFHPTDVELVMYYLKRKVMGKKFQLEAIAEVNINKYSPWDLPDKSCVRSRDLEWFFFCPREKKYASGARVKRATENGYWKTTGKDRPIHHNDKLVGTVKTLIFHLGHAPKGERTDWVLHEYRILDNKLAASGVQDTYVLCKVFKKNGPGPKNGAQYGAPFNEADWTDDDTDAQTDAISLASDGPSTTTLLQTEEQSCPVNGLSNPGNKPGLSLIEDQSTPPAHLTSEVFMHNSNTEDEMDRLLAQFTDEGAIPFNENGVNQVTSSAHPTSEVFMHETEDEMDRLLAQFTDEDMIPFNGDGVNQDNLGGKEKNPLPSSDGYDIYNGLCDLHSWSRGNVESLESWKVHSDKYYLENNLPLENSAYIELNDLLPLLDGPIGFTENSQPSTSEPFRTFTHENLQPSTSEPFRTFTQESIQHLNSGSYSDGIGQFTAYSNQLHVLPQTVSTSLYQERQEAAYDLDSVLGQLDNGVDFARGIERGSCAD